MLKISFSNIFPEAGTDEAGRGCLAGPVVAAAVILPENFENNLLNDSKKISHKNRLELKEIIINESLSYNIQFIEPEIIDEINILNSSILAMQNAVLELNPLPQFLIVDGNRFRAIENIPHQTIIKGDGKYLSIAAASILAKTARDEYMDLIHEEFPMYQWNKNKGYPTKDHRIAIEKFGITKYHRKSFKLLPDLKLDL